MLPVFLAGFPARDVAVLFGVVSILVEPVLVLLLVISAGCVLSALGGGSLWRLFKHCFLATLGVTRVCRCCNVVSLGGCSEASC